MPPLAYEIRRDDIPDLLHVMKRFWSKVDMTGECWEWTGGTITRPPGIPRYGSFWVGKHQYVAHRFLWAMLHGSIAKNQYVLHHCDNRLCVKPPCLFEGSQADNMLDMMRKGRHPNNGTKGEENPNAVINANDVQRVFELSEQGLTQREIGQIVGISQTHTGRILRRERWKEEAPPEDFYYRRLHEPTPDDTVREIRMLAKEGWSYRAIANHLRIPYPVAWTIATYRTRANVPDIKPTTDKS